MGQPAERCEDNDDDDPVTTAANHTNDIMCIPVGAIIMFSEHRACIVGLVERYDCCISMFSDYATGFRFRMRIIDECNEKRYFGKTIRSYHSIFWKFIHYEYTTMFTIDMG